jgi:hypothetical protein
MTNANQKTVEAIVLSVAPEDEDDSCDDEPRELWRQAKVVQYGKKLAGSPSGDCGLEDNNNGSSSSAVSARVQPFVKSNASRRQRAEAARTVRRRKQQQQGQRGSRRPTSASLSSTEMTSTDDEDERGFGGQESDDSYGSGTSSAGARGGGRAGHGSQYAGVSRLGTVKKHPQGEAAGAMNSYQSPAYKTRSSRGNKFKSRYGNTLRLEDAILTPGMNKLSTFTVKP